MAPNLGSVRKEGRAVGGVEGGRGEAGGEVTGWAGSDPINNDRASWAFILNSGLS